MSVSRRAAMAGSALLTSLGIALIAVALVMAGSARGADHRDSPGAEADKTADITDVYAFRSGDNLVIALGANGLTAPADNLSANFSNDVTYTIHVDKDSNLATDEATVNVNFSGSGDQQKFTVTGLGDPITGDVTPPSTAPSAPAPKITTAGPIKVFAGQRDDAFFFDLTAFKKFVAGPYVPAQGLRAQADLPPADTFKSTNVSYIVIELPITAVTDQANSVTGTIAAWASTSRASGQVDRMAIPAINTALIPSGQKDNFNKASPANDVTAFRATAQASVEGLRGAVDPVLGGPGSGGPLGNLTPQQVAEALIPDVVTIDFSKPVQFPNGRQLTDDVIDAALGVVLNRTVGDAINANDKAFDSSFPYLAAPTQPAATPTLAAQPPSGGQPSTDDGFDWTLPLMIGAGTMLIIGGGLLLKRRAVR